MSPKNQGYRIVHWVNHCPDELADSFCSCLHAIQDAPSEGLDREQHRHTTARLRKNEALTIAYGSERHVSAAVTESGEVAGFTQTVWYPEEPTVLDLWSTAVAREHRGRGLGLRIKAAATPKFARELPGARSVRTFNNHANEHMLAVNRRLGYQRIGVWEVHEFAC